MDSTPDTKALFDRLTKAGYADKMQNDLAWKIIIELLNNFVEGEIKYFCFNADTSDIRQMEKLKTHIRFFKYELPNFFENLKTDGEVAFEELKDIRALSPNLNTV